MNESWSAELKKSVVEEFEDREESHEFFYVLHAPYVQGFTESLQKELKKFGIGFVMKKGVTLASSLYELKQKTEKADRKDLDYTLKCKICDIKCW